jgi:hypothetical protein
MEKFKFILSTVLVGLLLGNSARGQLPTIYFDFYSGSQTTGTINVQVRNASNTVVYSGAYSNVTQNAGFKYTPTAVGTYTVSLVNNGLAPLNSTLCQVDGCFGFVKEQACGVGNAPNSRVSSGPVSASSTYVYTLNITSRTDFGVKCSSALGTSFDYYVGGIYINSGFHTQVTCLDAPSPSYASNGNFVNDSTVSVGVNSTLNLTAQCPSFYSSYGGEIDGYSSNPISEVITIDKVYKIRCKETNGICFSNWRKVYVKAVNPCVLPTTVNQITGITLNANYTGPNIFLVYAPAGKSGNWKWYENNVLKTSGTFTPVNYNPNLGAYEINANRPNTAYPYTITNPQIVSGAIWADLGGSTPVYKVNMHYFAYGAAVVWNTNQTSIQDYNWIKPEGLAATYTSCVNGQTRVIINSEPRVGMNNQAGSATLTVQRIAPNVSSVMLPTFNSAIGVYATPLDYDGSWGAVYDLGLLNAGVTYTYRIVGDRGVANGDYSDISFSPKCPNPVINSPSNAICIGDKAVLTASGCSSNICWSTGQSTASITVAPLVSTTYKVSCVTVDGDINTASFTVTVNSVLNTPTLTASSTQILPSQAVTLTAVGCASNTTVWSHNATLTSPTTIVNPTENTTYSIYCKTASTVQCNSKIASVSLTTFIDMPEVTSGVMEVCNGVGTVALSATGCDANASYLWSTGAVTTVINVPSSVNEYWVACVSGSLMSNKKFIKLKN